jgi:putative hemolysin
MIDQVVNHLFPRLARNGFAHRSLVNMLDRITCLSRFQEMVASVGHLSDLEFVDAFIQQLEVRYSVDGDVVSTVPSSGPLIVVANHPTGILEGFLLLSIIGRIRPDVKVIANEMLEECLTPMRSLILPVDTSASARHNPKQRDRNRAIMTALSTGGAIVVFPAGDVSRLNRWRVVDCDWNPGFVKLVQRTSAAVLPIYINARNSFLYYLAGSISRNAAIALLMREIFNQRAWQIRIRLGTLIKADELRATTMGEASEIAQALRVRCYDLAKTSK